MCALGFLEKVLQLWQNLQKMQRRAKKCQKEHILLYALPQKPQIVEIWNLARRYSMAWNDA